MLNALTVIRGYATQVTAADADAIETIQRRADEIEETVDEVYHLAGPVAAAEAGTTVPLIERVTARIDAIEGAHPSVELALDAPPGEIRVRADDRVAVLLDRLLEVVITRADGPSPRVEVDIETTPNTARVRVSGPGDVLDGADRALLESGTIPEYDDPGSDFELHLVRLMAARYGARLETDTADGRTAITLALPLSRAGSPDGREEADASPSIRPGIPHLAVVIVAALAAGGVFGAVSIVRGGSVAGIGVFYGAVSPVVGWITHQFHSLVFGFIYAGWLTLLPDRSRQSLAAYVGVGVGWGLALWLGAAGVIAPVWLQLLGTPAMVPSLSVTQLLTHVSWGVTLGALTGLGYRYAVPHFAGIEWPAWWPLRSHSGSS